METAEGRYNPIDVRQTRACLRYRSLVLVTHAAEVARPLGFGATRLVAMKRSWQEQVICMLVTAHVWSS